MAGGARALKTQIVNVVKGAVTETKDMAERRADTNINGIFYGGGTPNRYDRTYALRDTPRIIDFNFGDTGGGFTLDLDQSHQYSTGTSPWNTMSSVLPAAESNILAGGGGFWVATEADIEQDLNDNLGKALG